MIGSSRWCRLLAILCVTAISLQLLDVADGQAYHFSKGWMPGRKRSDAPAGGKVEARQPAAGVKSSNSPRPVIFDAELGRRSAAAAQVCAIKSQGYQSALDLLKARTSCVLISYIQ